MLVSVQREEQYEEVVSPKMALTKQPSRVKSILHEDISNQLIIGQESNERGEEEINLEEMGSKAVLTQ